MAEPVADRDLGSWRGGDVRLGEVIDALGELRRGGQRTATRASVTNLVIVADDEHQADRACGAVHRLGRRHPGRNIVLLPRPGAEPAGIDASVLLHGSVAGGHPVWSEDVRLDVRGAPANHLHSLIEPLTLPDLPVAVWFVHGVPDAGALLLRAADAVVVDADCLDAAGSAEELAAALDALVRLARRRVVVDLCWARLRPWRQLAAAQFDLPELRPLVTGVEEAVVEGPVGPRLLLAGWLAARLSPAPAFTVRSAPSLSLRLVAGDAVVTVAEAAGPAGAVVRAGASVAGAARREDGLSQPDDPLAWSLGEALTRLRRDRAYGEALHGALELARRTGAPA